MSDFLYPNYLSDPAEYAKAEGAWLGAWRVLSRYAGPADDWKTPWLRTTFVDGTVWRDGNPVFTAYSASRRLGIRVIQLEPAEDPSELTIWTDYYARGEREEIKELVIACVLTDATLADATDLMTQWVERGEIILTDPHEFLFGGRASNLSSTLSDSPRFAPLVPQHRLRATEPLPMSAYRPSASRRQTAVPA